MVKTILNFFKEVLKTEVVECKCCPRAIFEEDRLCTCQEEQEIRFEDGDVHKFKTTTVCSDWNCSHCH